MVIAGDSFFSSASASAGASAGVGAKTLHPSSSSAASHGSGDPNTVLAAVAGSLSLALRLAAAGAAHLQPHQDHFRQTLALRLLSFAFRRGIVSDLGARLQPAASVCGRLASVLAEEKLTAHHSCAVRAMAHALLLGCSSDHVVQARALGHLRREASLHDPVVSLLVKLHVAALPLLCLGNARAPGIVHVEASALLLVLTGTGELQGEVLEGLATTEAFRAMGCALTLSLASSAEIPARTPSATGPSVTAGLVWEHLSVILQRLSELPGTAALFRLGFPQASPPQKSAEKLLKKWLAGKAREIDASNTLPEVERDKLLFIVANIESALANLAQQQ